MRLQAVKAFSCVLTRTRGGQPGEIGKIKAAPDAAKPTQQETWSHAPREMSCSPPFRLRALRLKAHLRQLGLQLCLERLQISR